MTVASTRTEDACTVADLPGESYSALAVQNTSGRRDRQVIRVLGLLKALSEGGHPTVHRLAARFKTRRETIYRDIHTLEAIGYPVVGDESGRLSRPLGSRRSRNGRGCGADAQGGHRPCVGNTGHGQPFCSALATAMAKLQAMAAACDGHSCGGARRGRRRVGPRRQELRRERACDPASRRSDRQPSPVRRRIPIPTCASANGIRRRLCGSYGMDEWSWHFGLAGCSRSCADGFWGGEMRRRL